MSYRPSAASPACPLGCLGWGTPLHGETSLIDPPNPGSPEETHKPTDVTVTFISSASRETREVNVLVFWYIIRCGTSSCGIGFGRCSRHCSIWSRISDPLRKWHKQRQTYRSNPSPVKYFNTLTHWPWAWKVSDSSGLQPCPNCSWNCNIHIMNKLTG